MHRAALPATAVLVLALAVSGSIVVGLLAADPVAASPQEHDVCPVCDDDAFDAAGGTRTALVSVEESTATWRVEVKITNESLSSAWRDDPPDVDPGRPLVGDDYGNTSVEVTDDDRLVVEFTHGGFTRPGVAGTRHLAYFPPPGAAYVLNVHEFTVESSEGFVVATAPPGATVTDDRVTWRTDGPVEHGADRGAPPRIEHGHVVFVPRDATAPTARAWLSVATAAVRPAVNGLHPLYWAVLYAGLAGVLASTHFGRSTAKRPGRRRLVAVVAVAGSLPVFVIAGIGTLGLDELSGPVGTLVTSLAVFVAGLCFGVFGLVCYEIAAGSALEGRV